MYVGGSSLDEVIWAYVSFGSKQMLSTVSERTLEHESNQSQSQLHRVSFIMLETSEEVNTCAEKPGEYSTGMQRHEGTESQKPGENSTGSKNSTTKNFSDCAEHHLRERKQKPTPRGGRDGKPQTQPQQTVPLGGQ